MQIYLAHITATDIGLGIALFVAGILGGVWLANRFARSTRRS